MSVHPDRVRSLRTGDIAPGPVLYWMRRDQRVRDNWGLLHAQAWALAHERPLAVAFCLMPEFLGATSRHYDFMIAGLQQVAADLAALDIPFVLLRGDPAT